MSLSKLIDALKTLSETTFNGTTSAVYYTAQTALLRLYNVALTGSLTQEEKRDVAHWIGKGLMQLEYYLNSYRFSVYNLYEARAIRSGVQYILDDYSTMLKEEDDCVEKEEGESEWEYFAYQIDLETLDRHLRDYWLYEYYPIFDKSESELPERLAKIPKSHWWWF